MFRALVDIPQNAGRIVSVKCDFEGSGKFTDAVKLKKSALNKPVTIVKFRHIFMKPGTYFPSILVESQREGDSSTPFALIRNLGRVRIVVAD
jgi:hypothetical protein